MSLDKLFTAFVLGLSWERLFICPFMAIGLSLSDRWAGLRFILGRLLGIGLLGLIITLVGIPFSFPPGIIDGIMGLFLLGLGASVFFVRPQHKNKPQRFSNAGFGLGLVRGFIYPGRKLIYLIPLLVGAKIPEGITISLTYGLSSSTYPLLGFFSAEILNRVFVYQRMIKITGAIVIVLLGAFYIFLAVQEGF